MPSTSTNKIGKVSRTHYASQLTKEDIGFEVIVAGWIEDFRDIGKLGFIMLRDVSGLISHKLHRIPVLASKVQIGVLSTTLNFMRICT